MGIRAVTEKELHWVNEQYQKIDFVPSTLENEIIAIVTYQDRFAGIGRMVYLNEEEAEIGGIYILDEFRGLSLAHELVAYLVEEAKSRVLKEVYCLPFHELKHFYEKFGFTTFDVQNTAVNEKILKKFNWCLGNYQKEVLLLKLHPFH